MSKRFPRIGIVDWHLNRDFYLPITSSYSARWLDVSPALLSHQPPDLDLVLVNDETWPYCAAGIANATRLGIPSLHLPDGLCEWRNTWNLRRTVQFMQPLLSTKIACLGRSQAQLLESWGNVGKCVITGSPRFDWLVGRRPRQPRQSTVLIATARQPFFQDNDFKAVVASLMDLKSWLDEHTGITPIWRLTGGLDKIINVNSSASIPLADQLAKVDAVICTPSNVILESMAHGLPVALLDYTNSPQYIRASWSITANTHFSDAIHGILAADPCRMKWQAALLADQLECHTEATPRVIALMEDLMSGSLCAGQHNPSPSQATKEAELEAEIAHLRQIISLSSTQVAYRCLCEVKRWLGHLRLIR
jgi:hypothetical protein